MLNFDQILVLIVIVFIIISLYKELIGPAFTFMIGISVLGLFGILSANEMLAGFANENVIVIILLLLLGDIIRRNSIIEYIFDNVFRHATSYKKFMLQMMSMIAAFSAFLNNTPLVAVMMPYVNSWSKKNGVAQSKLLIPLSYAAILGGAITIIGTSTNLIVNGMVEDQMIIKDLPHLHFFAFAWVGIPMVIIGFIYMLTIGHRLLPNNINDNSDSINSREYTVEAQIRENSSVVGKSIEEADLRDLKGLFLVRIIRGDLDLPAVSPQTVLAAKDILVFAGETDAIAEFIDNNSELIFPQVGMLNKKKHIDIVEVVISHNSTLINRTVKEANFRGKYDAAIVAIHRNGEKIYGKIGEIQFKAGDALLLFAGENLANRADIFDFYFISRVKDLTKVEAYKSLVLLGGTITVIALSALNILPLFFGLVLLFIVILSLKIASPKDLHKSIDFNLALIIVLSLALGIAMTKTGIAQIIGNNFINIMMPLGLLGILYGIYFITTILAAFITNLAAVAIMFPISLSIALKMEVAPTPFVLLVAFAAAANFMTPIGYQTNLMVYGPGGYKFRDYLKVGAPLSLIYMIVAVSILYYLYYVNPVFINYFN